MQFLTCNTDAVPCAPADQVWRTAAEVTDPAALGITPEAIAGAYGIGFGASFSMFLVGYVIAVALGLIRKV